jgi:hypothetical protein
MSVGAIAVGSGTWFGMSVIRSEVISASHAAEIVNVDLGRRKSNYCRAIPDHRPLKRNDRDVAQNDRFAFGAIFSDPLRSVDKHDILFFLRNDETIIPHNCYAALAVSCEKRVIETGITKCQDKTRNTRCANCEQTCGTKSFQFAERC